MRRALPLVMITALLACSALYAAGTGSVIVSVERLTPGQASALLSASSSLIWDRQTSRAVAAVSQAGLARLSGMAFKKMGPFAGAAGFRAAALAQMPALKDEQSGGARFAMKEPAALVRPPGARIRPPVAESSACLSEDFETTPIWYEDGGPWWHYEGGQPYNNVGNYFWLDDNCEAHTGQWEASAILGGSIGKTLPCGATYASDTDSWLEYAPWITCAVGVPAANLSFFTQISSEQDSDWFYYLVTVDGTNYVGYRLSGNYADAWYAVQEDLRNWEGLSDPDITHYPKFALAFAFQSNHRTNQGFGAKIDDIALNTTSMAAVASSDLSSGLIPLTVHFTGTILGGTGPFTTTWDFGDGTPPSSDRNPVHTFGQAGSYLVVLTVADSTGTSSSGRVTINAHLPVYPAVSSMARATSPFRLVTAGSGFDPQIKVYINGAPWSTVTWKNASKVVIAGGAALKAVVPRGVPATFLFENPDGEVTTYTFSW